jgi:hypothetical protein
MLFPPRRSNPHPCIEKRFWFPNVPRRLLRRKERAPRNDRTQARPQTQMRPNPCTGHADHHWEPWSVHRARVNGTVSVNLASRSLREARHPRHRLYFAKVSVDDVVRAVTATGWVLPPTWLRAPCPLGSCLLLGIQLLAHRIAGLLKLLDQLPDP